MKSLKAKKNCYVSLHIYPRNLFFSNTGYHILTDENR